MSRKRKKNPEKCVLNTDYRKNILFSGRWIWRALYAGFIKIDITALFIEVYGVYPFLKL